jgi:hypothetical protein
MDDHLLQQAEPLGPETGVGQIHAEGLRLSCKGFLEPIKRRKALGQSRVRIMEETVQGMGGEIGEIVFAQPQKG